LVQNSSMVLILRVWVRKESDDMNKDIQEALSAASTR